MKLPNLTILRYSNTNKFLGIEITQLENIERFQREEVLRE